MSLILDHEHAKSSGFNIAHQAINDDSEGLFCCIMARFPHLLFEHDKFNQTPFLWLCSKSDRTRWFSEFSRILEYHIQHENREKREKFEKLVFTQNCHGYNCLFIAAHSRNFKMCQELIKYFPKLCNFLDQHENSFLWWIEHLFIPEQTKEWLDLLHICFPLFNHKVKFQKTGEFQQNVCHFALSSRKWQLFEALINLCPEYLNIPNCKNALPLHIVVERDNHQIELLHKVIDNMDHSLWLSKTRDVFDFYNTKRNGSNALHWAIISLKFTMVEELLKCIPQLCNIPDDDGYLPLSYLLHHNSHEVSLLENKWRYVVHQMIFIMGSDVCNKFLAQHQTYFQTMSVENAWFRDELNKL